MKLSEALWCVKMDDEKDDQYLYNVKLRDICDDLGVEYSYDFPDEFEARLKQIPMYNWLCTDEIVGLDAIYFDGKPVAAYYKSARKNDFEIKWLSKEDANNLRDAILAALPDSSRLSFISDDNTVSEFYPMPSASASLTNEGYYQGRPVKILVWYDWYHPETPPHKRKIGETYYVKVDYKDELNGQVLIQDSEFQLRVNLSDITIPINVHGVV